MIPDEARPSHSFDEQNSPIAPRRNMPYEGGEIVSRLLRENESLRQLVANQQQMIRLQNERLRTLESRLTPQETRE